MARAGERQGVSRADHQIDRSHRVDGGRWTHWSLGDLTLESPQKFNVASRRTWLTRARCLRKFANAARAGEDVSFPGPTVRGCLVCDTRCSSKGAASQPRTELADTLTGKRTRRVSGRKTWSVAVRRGCASMFAGDDVSGFLNEKRSVLASEDVQTSSTSKRQVASWRALRLYGPDHQITRSPDHQITRSPDHQLFILHSFEPNQFPALCCSLEVGGDRSRPSFHGCAGRGDVDSEVGAGSFGQCRSLERGFRAFGDAD